MQIPRAENRVRVAGAASECALRGHELRRAHDAPHVGVCPGPGHYYTVGRRDYRVGFGSEDSCQRSAEILKGRLAWFCAVDVRIVSDEDLLRMSRLCYARYRFFITLFADFAVGEPERSRTGSCSLLCSNVVAGIHEHASMVSSKIRQVTHH